MLFIHASFPPGPSVIPNDPSELTVNVEVQVPET